MEFKCSACGEVIKETDYDWKDANLFASLKKGGKCEDCVRLEGYGEILQRKLMIVRQLKKIDDLAHFSVYADGKGSFELYPKSILTHAEIVRLLDFCKDFNLTMQLMVSKVLPDRIDITLSSH